MSSARCDMAHLGTHKLLGSRFACNRSQVESGYSPRGHVEHDLAVAFGWRRGNPRTLARRLMLGPVGRSSARILLHSLPLSALATLSRATISAENHLLHSG